MIGGIFLAIMELIMVIQQQMYKRNQLAEEKKMIEQQIKEIEKMYGVKISNDILIVERDDKPQQAQNKSDTSKPSYDMVFSNAPSMV